MPLPPRPDWRLDGASLPRAARFFVADYPTALQLRLGGTRVPDWSDGDRAPVVLLPGVYEQWWYLRTIAERLHGLGHPVIALPELGRNLRPIEESAEIAAGAIARLGLRATVLLAHSKGGLIGKTLMLRHDPDGRVDRLVAIATPWTGSGVAAYAPNRALRDFRTTDPLVVALAAEREVNRRISSVYPLLDPHIPEGSRLEGARNLPLRMAGHFSALVRTEAVDAVVAEVERDRTDAGPA